MKLPPREDGLRAIKRYAHYPVMRYRSNVYEHSRRVAMIVRELAPLAHERWGTGFNKERAVLLALVHDDIEIVTGDYLAGNKALMSTVELQKIKDEEQSALTILAKAYPTKFHNCHYEDLIYEAYQAETTEALLMKYADKWDGFGEALHEIFGGNIYFAKPITTQHGEIEPAPLYYINFLGRFREQTTALRDLFAVPHPLLEAPSRIDFQTIAEYGQAHTRATLSAASDYAPYDAWKKAVLAFGEPSDIEALVMVRE